MDNSNLLEIAAQAWCQPTTCSKEMDPALCLAFAKILEQQLAAAQKEIEGLRTHVEQLGEIGLNQQARIAELRGALEVASDMATQAMSGYGFYRPEDPHNFFPDLSMCSPEEIAAHSAACEAYDRREKIADGTWGIGTYTDSIPQVDAALAKKDDLSALEAAKLQAYREALMEAADDFDTTGEWKGHGDRLRRMAWEVK